jgi:hypothetical protein
MLRRLTIAMAMVGAMSAPAAAQFSNRDVEKFDAIKLLLDNRKVLKIDERQRGELERLHVPVKWNIKKLSARVDSAQRDMDGGRGGMRGSRGVGGSDDSNLSPEALRARLLAARKTLLEALAELRREYELTGTDALGVLTDAQRPRALELIKKRSDDLRTMVDDAGFGAAARRDERRDSSEPSGARVMA